MKSVNRWFNMVKAEGLTLACSMLADGWGFEMDQQNGATFHFVSEGYAHVQVPGESSVVLRPFDLVIFPRGAPHRCMHQPNGTTMTMGQFMASGVLGSSLAATTLICGTLSSKYNMPMTMESLPSMIILRSGSDSLTRPILETLRLLLGEIESGELGDKIIVRNLLSNLFIYVCRARCLNAGSAGVSTECAVPDGRIPRVLSAVECNLAKSWSIDELAKEAGLSRTRFLKEFRHVTGESPHQYLIRRRIAVGSHLLERTNLPLSTIAEQVGYLSEFSFSRAFKHICQISPMQLRRASSAK